MAVFIMLVGLMNVIGGRFADVIGRDNGAMGGRLIFRCILPGIAAGFTAYDHGMSKWLALYVWGAVTWGSAIWFVPGWSFDEIDGGYDVNKYPRILQRIGLWLVPLDISDTQASTNRRRGIILKAMRGLYDMPTYIMLAFVNPCAPLIGLGTASMGLVYWFSGRLVIYRYAIMLGELLYGLTRGALIGYVIYGQS